LQSAGGRGKLSRKASNRGNRSCNFIWAPPKGREKRENHSLLAPHFDRKNEFNRSSGGGIFSIKHYGAAPTTVKTIFDRRKAF
jgi:hypothetical protein